MVSISDMPAGIRPRTGIKFAPTMNLKFPRIHQCHSGTCLRRRQESPEKFSRVASLMRPEMKRVVKPLPGKFYVRLI